MLKIHKISSKLIILQRNSIHFMINSKNINNLQKKKYMRWLFYLSKKYNQLEDLYLNFYMKIILFLL